MPAHPSGFPRTKLLPIRGVAFPALSRIKRTALLRATEKLSGWHSLAATKAPRISGALLFGAAAALINFNKVRIACADHAFRVDKAVHVNRDPAAVHENEVRVPDQPEMVLTKSLGEELFRMPP